MASAHAGQAFEDFSGRSGLDWVYVADGVMGGVSQGEAAVINGSVRLTGTVSTENNGGFIQVRTRFDGGIPTNAQGLKLRVKGNQEAYYVFLRTRGLARPWYSYRHAFVTGPDWAEVILPFDKFKASRESMPQSFTPDQVISIGLVAYGRDHAADLSVTKIELF